ncbi:hypothetical protein Tdes44962_MAKER09886 [Teratosphaeria destructans]|uniref:Uncharacterized protein n=1 Tax=Teratosphaeria destructans TaxID=418781 RepID=A0A9W7SQN6_9PEZI|nr:hypothetical protein Tdes44962_MAKER09886 [Teratosphaeria destructans]
MYFYRSTLLAILLLATASLNWALPANGGEPPCGRPTRYPKSCAPIRNKGRLCLYPPRCRPEVPSDWTAAPAEEG